MEAAFATTWCNDLAVAVRHILQETNLETGVFMVRDLGQPSCTSWYVSGLLPVHQKKGSKVVVVVVVIHFKRIVQ